MTHPLYHIKGLFPTAILNGIYLLDVLVKKPALDQALAPYPQYETAILFVGDVSKLVDADA